MRYYLPLLFLIVSLLSCSDDDPVIHRVNPDITPGSSTTGGESNIDLTTQLVDLFAAGTLENYYLWIDDPGRFDLIEAVFNPDTCAHPVAALSRVLSKEDRWTSLIENMTERNESISGTEVSTGMDMLPYLFEQNSNRVIFVVTYVHPGSPADIAGIKRGDVINKVDGKYYTVSNYKRFYDKSTTMKLTIGKYNADGSFVEEDKVVTLTPIKTYLEPVIMTKVFDIDGSKKVGYMHYTQFTDSLTTLIEAMDEFKREGVSELIMDLRYNSGGYVRTCIALASMMAPKSVVENKEIFNTDIYNKLLTEAYKKSNYDLDEYFDKKYIEHNPGFSKIYFLVSRYTASASESLIVGLNPYMKVTLIGEQTHGKFCTGMMMTPEMIFKEDFYKKYKDGFKDWGIYVMVGTFADKNGYNGSRPDGFTPNTILEENPFDGYDLGDPHETLLREALAQAGMKIAGNNASTRALDLQKKLEVERPSYNIITDLKAFRKYN